MYDKLKILIENNKYEKEDMLRKLSIYLKANKITKEEYENLFSMLN